MLLQDKVALVTGGGAGIGEATALMFHREGAAVVVADINGEAAAAVAQRINADGDRALAVAVNVAEEGQVAAMVQRAVDAFGRLDCASNNAAASGGFAPLQDVENKNWQRAQDVTLKGVWLCMKYQIPVMLQQGGGAIVNIASLSGIRGEALQSPYSAAKGGVIALTKTAAAENAQHNLRINAVAPGGIRTAGMEYYFNSVPGAREKTEGVHAMRRLGEPREVADAVVYLLSDRASFITGHVLNVDGGITINPHTL